MFSSRSASAESLHPADSAMLGVYNELVERVKEKLNSERKYWIAVAGGPGSGKTTLSEAVASRLNAIQPDSSVVIPMDGYHFSKEKLKELDPPDGKQYLARRGAPWTFDAESFVEQVVKAKVAGHAVFPTYSRAISDPVSKGVTLKQSHKIVFVEGLYLLLLSDPRWAPLDKVWDERWFIRCETRQIQKERLVQRSLLTWTDAKAALWGEGEPGALARVEANDLKNMDIVDQSEQFADLVIESLS